jgi:hypothetical protein
LEKWPSGDRGPSSTIGQLAVIAAVVATLLLVPVAIIGVLCALAFGISPLVLMSWGGIMPAPAGLLATWSVLYIPAAIYVALVLHQ